MSDLGFCACRVLPGVVHIAGGTCTSVGEPTVLLPYWRLHLPASNLSPRMICAYTGYHAPHPLGHAHRSRQYPAQACRGVYRRELGRTAPSSAATRYRSLQRLFRWLDDGGEIDGSPMAKMYPRSSRSSNPSTCTYTVAAALGGRRFCWALFSRRIHARRAVGGYLRAEPHAVQPIRGTAQAVPHLEQQAGHIRLRFSGRGDRWATMGE